MGYGNATGYHGVSQARAPGVSCSDGRGGPSWDDDRLDSRDPADACYTGTYSTDAFLGRARQVKDAADVGSRCRWIARSNKVSSHVYEVFVFHVFIRPLGRVRPLVSHEWERVDGMYTFFFINFFLWYTKRCVESK